LPNGEKGWAPLIYQITKVLQQNCPVIVTAIVSDAFQWDVSTFWLLVIQQAIKNSMK
jgi:hypothetical protein